MGFDTKFWYGIYSLSNKKKTVGVWTKCGFEINKEIKRNEAEKWWGLIESIYIYIIKQRGRKIFGFGQSVDLKLTKK